MSIVQWGLLLLALVVFFWAVGAYNRLVRLRNAVANAFAQIDVQLKRRHDLIPNLVEVARKYLQHEAQTLEAVIAARNTPAAPSRRRSPGRSAPRWWPRCRVPNKRWAAPWASSWSWWRTTPNSRPTRPCAS